MAAQLARLPDAELEVMQALWSLGEYPAHTADIAARLNRDWKAPTLLKLLSRLEERGFVRGEKAGRVNLYTPLVGREEYLAFDSRAVLDRLYGTPRNFVAALARDGLDRGELEELQALLEELKGGPRE